jgi:hypothetical protein
MRNTMTIKLPRINVDRLSLTTGSWWSTGDVIEDEATRESSKSGLPMLATNFLAEPVRKPV